MTRLSSDTDPVNVDVDDDEDDEDDSVDVTGERPIVVSQHPAGVDLKSQDVTGPFISFPIQSARS